MDIQILSFLFNFFTRSEAQLWLIALLMGIYAIHQLFSESWWKKVFITGALTFLWTCALTNSPLIQPVVALIAVFCTWMLFAEQDFSWLIKMLLAQLIPPLLVATLLYPATGTIQINEHIWRSLVQISALSAALYFCISVWRWIRRKITGKS